MRGYPVVIDTLPDGNPLRIINLLWHIGRSSGSLFSYPKFFRESKWQLFVLTAICILHIDVAQFQSAS